MNKLALVLLLLPSIAFAHGSSHHKLCTLLAYTCSYKQDKEDLISTCVSWDGRIVVGRSVGYYSKQSILEREERLHKWDLR